jgi:hypothetical protein
MSTEKDRTEEEEALIQNEIEEYRKLIRKEKEKSEEPTSSFTVSKDGKRAKTVSLSSLISISLRSPQRETELSKKEQLDSKIKHCVDCILRYNV